VSMTAEAKKWHQVYEDMTPYEQHIIDTAYTELRRIISNNSRCTPANDDRAEELVAAITKYYKESLDD
jgi:hypothetical protein